MPALNSLCQEHSPPPHSGHPNLPQIAVHNPLKFISPLPRACTFHEAKQNPRSSHTPSTHSKKNSSMRSGNKNRFLPEGNAVATQIGFTYKYQSKGQAAGAGAVARAQAERQEHILPVPPRSGCCLPPLSPRVSPPLPSLWHFTGIQTHRMNLTQSPQNRLHSLFSFCLLRCCSICLKYLISAEALKELAFFSCRPDACVSELSHQRGRKRRVDCRIGSFPPSEQMLQQRDPMLQMEGKIWRR